MILVMNIILEMNDEMSKFKFDNFIKKLRKRVFIFSLIFPLIKGCRAFIAFYAPVIEHLYKYTYATCIQ